MADSGRGSRGGFGRGRGDRGRGRRGGRRGGRRDDEKEWYVYCVCAFVCSPQLTGIAFPDFVKGSPSPNWAVS